MNTQLPVNIKRPVNTKLTIRVPGSTANIGPGLDTLALALSIYSEFSFELLEKNDPKIPLVTLVGDIAKNLQTDESNLVFRVFKKLWHDKPELLSRLRITIKSDIPLGRGLGSSASAIIASVWAAYALAGKPVDKEIVLAEATEIEGHPDNLAASLFGGLVISANGEGTDNTIFTQRIFTQQIEWPDDWQTLFVVPSYTLSTEKSRSVLPLNATVKDAVANVQRTSLLVSAVINKDEAAFSEALKDKLHEPYRMELVPELKQLKDRLSKLPILGCVLSGAGPSVLIVVHKRHKQQILDELNKWASTDSITSQIMDLSVSRKGLAMTGSSQLSARELTHPSLKNAAVLKFGGTSVKNLGRIKHVAEIIDKQRKNGPVVVVVSAMGDTTDYLLKLAHQCSHQPDQRELDHLLATGEQISITLLAMMLRSQGIKACSFTAQQVGIFTESVHNKARIVDIKTSAIEKAFENNDVLVVAGFQGITTDGDVTTLGRGGSDTTAVAFAAAIGAKECDIYTDVDGIYTADPNVIADARLLSQISYDEVVEMARLGAQVIHPRAVGLARQYNVTLRVRNTFKPNHRGTIIDGGDNMEIQRIVSGVAIDKDQARVAILDVPDQPGMAAKIMQAIADKNIVIDMIMQAFHPNMGFNNITFTVHSADLDQTIKILNELKEQVKAREVLADSDIAKVSIVGAGMVGNPGIAAKLFKILGEGGINIKMIATSEMKLTCVVAKDEAEKAAKIIHKAFELEKV